MDEFDKAENKTLADRVTSAVGAVGVGMAHADIQAGDEAAAAEVMSDPHKAFVTGYLAGIDIGINVAICKARNGADVAPIIAKSMALSIHGNDSNMHEIAEDLIADVFMVMVESLAEAGDSGIISVEANSYEEAIEKVRPMVVAAIAARLPKKERDDA